MAVDMKTLIQGYANKSFEFAKSAVKNLTGKLNPKTLNNILELVDELIKGFDESKNRLLGSDLVQSCIMG